MRNKIAILVIITVLSAVALTISVSNILRPNSGSGNIIAERARVVENFGKLPLSFEANNGQTDDQVRFLARGQGYRIFLTPQEAVLVLKVDRPEPTAALGSITRAVITINDNDEDPRLNVPVLQIDQTLIDFDRQLINTTATRTVTVRNSGRAPLSLAAPMISGFAGATFTISAPPATLTVAAGQSTTFTVAFTPTVPLPQQLTGQISVRSNGGTATIQLRGRGFDDVAPAVSLLSPTGNETLTAGQAFTIRFTGTDNDQVSGFIVAASTDGGASFSREIARLGGGQREVRWNIPELLDTRLARIRVMARDRAGNSAMAVSSNFIVQRPAGNAPALQVNISFEPPPPGQIAPPQNVKVSASEMPKIAVNTNAEGDDELPLELIGYNIYRVVAPAQGEPLPRADEIVGNPDNLVGSVGASSTSFTDMVTTNTGQNFVYSITSFFGGGQQSMGSMPVSTDLPVVKNPRFEKGTILLEAAGSFIHNGAMLIINESDSFTLQFDSSGALLTVPKKVRGSGGKTVKKLIKKGATVRLMVKNPDGKVSVAVIFTRTS